MDRPTLDAYERGAEAYADAWLSQPEPSDLHAVLRRFFAKGSTADIGCGSGREVAWLNAHGFPTVGYDVSGALLAAARRRHPKMDFRIAALPTLEEVAANAFDNVVCETVIMHLPRVEIAPAVKRLLDIVRPGGILYLSWRVTDDADMRDKDGRLYCAFDAGLVRDALAEATILLDEAVVSASSGKAIYRIVARKA